MLCSGGRFIVKGKDSRVAERGQRLGKEGDEEVTQMRQGDKNFCSKAWWCTPVILTLKAETGELGVQG